MSRVAKTSHNALGAYALRQRRRVAAADRAWRAFAARTPATVVHSPRSTDFTIVRSPASNTTSCASRLRCFRLGTVVDPGRLARGISSVSIAYARHGVGLLNHAVAPLELRTSHAENWWSLLALQDTFPKARLRMEAAPRHHAAPGGTLRDRAGRTTRSSSRGGGRDRAARAHLAGAGARRQLVGRDWQRRQSHDRRPRPRHCRRARRRQNTRRMARSPVRGPLRGPDPVHRAARRGARYAISANRAATRLGWFRAVAKKYPDKPASVVLGDLVRHTPGEEGKWFAAA